MTFIEAYENFKKGKSVRRKNWPAEYFMRIGNPYPDPRNMESTNNVSCVYTIDMLVDDWVILENGA